MKVLIVTSYKSFPGGVERVNAQLENSLKRMGHSVEYLAADGPWNFTERLGYFFFRLAGVTALRYRNLAQETKKTYDLIIANGEHALGITHPKVLNYFHGSYLGLRGKRPCWHKSYWTLSYLSLVQKWASRGKKVLSVSSFLNTVLEKQGIKVWKIFSPAIDCSLFFPETTVQKEGDYLFVGSGSYYNKGFDLLDALALKGKKSTCISQRRQSPLLEFHTDISSNEMPLWYRKFKFFIFPSRFESFGLAPLEAMASGLPLLMFDIGIGEEIKKKLPEFILSLEKEDHPEDFLRRIKTLEENYENLSKRAREFVTENYSLECFDKNLQKILEELFHA